MNHIPRRAMLAAAMLLSLAACSREGDVRAAGGAVQSIQLVDAAGVSVGSVSVGDDAGALAITVDAREMTPGIHGIICTRRGAAKARSSQARAGTGTRA